MENYKVKIYQEEYYTLWNNFVAESKNATFLFHRDFMEYHKDRFQDYSLLIFDEKDTLQAVFPANIKENQLYSHQGLTYGGLVLQSKTYFHTTLEILKSLLSFLNQNNIETLFYKEIPSFYTQFYNDEVNYLLFQIKAELVKREMNTVIDLKKTSIINKDRQLNIKKSLKKDYIIKKSNEPKLFWDEILTPLLEQKHFTKPTHNFQEIELLMLKFPDNIFLYEIWNEVEILAGTLLFVNKNVIHTQYIAKKTDRDNYALDYLFNELIFKKFKDYKVFDFGISNEYFGSKVNEGLIYWKESFGGRSICQDFYKIETRNFVLLDDILIKR